MATYNPRRDNAALYEAAHQWAERSLLQSASVLSDVPNLWNLANLDELDLRFVQNYDEGSGTFLEKLKGQLSGGTPQCHKLMAELMWALNLFPSNAGSASKRTTVREIWSWSRSELPIDHPYLSDAILAGIGSAGPAYQTAKWRELSFVITALRELRKLDAGSQAEILGDPWRFIGWLQEQPGAQRRQLTHILPHLIFPESFERISSAGDKRKILAAFTGEAQSIWKKRTPIEVDRALQGLRQKLEQESGEPIDFYSHDLLEQWKGTQSSSPQSTAIFAASFEAFLAAYEDARGGLFSTSGPIAASMKQLKSWLENCPPISDRPTIKVRISVGQGGWTKTPWIALLDDRVTRSTQRGIYIVFLVAEDLAVTHLTLNQGLTDLVGRLGQRGAVEEMLKVAQAARPKIAEITAEQFQLDNGISLHSDTTAARNYEVGTIAHLPILRGTVPDDEQMTELLEVLLEAYDCLIEGEEASENPTPMPVEPSQPYSLDDALAELFLEREVAEQLLLLWRAKRNIIIQGPPGVGKSFAAQRLAFAHMKAKDRDRLGFVQFHQSYSYEDFVEGYRPTETGFELRSGKFVEFCRQAEQDPSNDYVFIIDEINRGNLSKILGELMLLIEGDKRDRQWAMPLASGREKFFVPPNVYLLGLMNTADRSLAVVDYALRRRFAFVDLAPNLNSAKFKAHLTSRGISAGIVETVIARIGVLNAEIVEDVTNLGPGFAIGHSYFCSDLMAGETDRAWYERIIRTEIVPLLREYWFDAPQKAEAWSAQLLAPL